MRFSVARFTDPPDLVFPNPATGRPQQRGEVHRRLKRTLRRAGIREELSLSTGYDTPSGLGSRRRGSR